MLFGAITGRYPADRATGVLVGESSGRSLSKVRDLAIDPKTGPCYCFPMRIIARRTLREYLERYPLAEQPLKAWFGEADASDWARPSDLKRRYRHASILRGNRVVLSIGGNKYRLVVQINYDFKIIYIRFVGSHEAYDKVDAETV